MRVLIVTIIFCIGFLSSPMAQEQNTQIDFQAMLDEMIEHTRASVGKEPHPWMTEIAEKYIPLGTDQELLLEQCRENGWAVTNLTHRSYNEKNLKKFDAMFKCGGKEFKLAWWHIWGYSAQISLDFKDQKLAKLSSRVAYKHPLF